MRHIKILKGATLYDRDTDKEYIADNDFIVEDFQEHCGHARFVVFSKRAALEYSKNRKRYSIQRNKQDKKVENEE